MRNKRFLALSMTVLMAVTTISVPANIVKAEQVEQEYVVLAKNDVGLEKAETKYGEDEVKESEQLEDNNVLVIEMTEKEAQKLEKDKDILLVEEDILFEGSDFEDEDFDEIYGSESDLEDETEMKEFLKELRSSDSVAVDVEDQWNIDVINANEQEYIQVNDKVKVAVLDTGVTATEDIDVAGRVNFIEGEEEVNPLYEDVSGHGTSVASVIAAKQNDIGITGINPNAELYSVKILDDQKKASLSGIIEGIYWCIDHDIDIINMSFGTSVKSEILEQVIKEADKAGILMIAAAGNKGERAGESTVEYPAAFAEVIAVGASTPQGEVSDMSSVGKEVELMAPGESVPATGYFDEVIKTDGTSMAAPHVAGVASILWAKDRSKSSAYIRALLNASAKAIGDEKKNGSGIVDLDYALTVYDEFAANYVEDAEEINEGIVGENTAEVESYEDAEVNASWNYSDHVGAVGLYDQTSASALNVIKIGAKIPDTVSYLKYNSGKTDSFHGHYNYVANYMYVMRMARICYNSGMSQALSTAKYPCNGNGKEQIYNGIKQLNNNWNSVLSGYAVNNNNKARVLVGIATHIAMDVYAHKAYIKNSSGQWKKHISGDAYQDSTSYVPSRWTCAKSIAYDVIDVWHFGWSPNAWEFYQSSHNKDKFRLYKFKTYVSSADSSTYSSEKNWYSNRTADAD